MAQCVDGPAAVRQRDSLRRRGLQQRPPLAARFHPHAHVPRCPAEDLDPTEPVRLASVCRAGAPAHARFLRSG